MDRGVAVLVMAAVGGLIALQPAVNAGLGKATGNVAAALVSFAIGTLLLVALVALGAEADRSDHVEPADEPLRLVRP